MMFWGTVITNLKKAFYTAHISTFEQFYSENNDRFAGKRWEVFTSENHQWAYLLGILYVLIQTSVEFIHLANFQFDYAVDCHNITNEIGI